MRNNGELKKLIGAELLAILLFSLIFAGVLYKQYQVYTHSFNEKISEICAKVKETYPEVDENSLAAILNEKGGDDSTLLRKYGIDLEKESAVLENDRHFRNFMLFDGALLLLFLSVILGLFLKFNRSRDKKISEITAYLEEINKGNYKLDISDNSEESLSILKNELYKTTVMLNEVAENSVQDKVQLKDSLSDISHQLKTPLTSILIMLDAILDDGDMDEDTRNGFIRDIKREVTGTKFLVESLLKLSKLDSNTMKFIEQEVSVEEILAEAVKNVEILGELRGIAVKVSGKAEKKLLCDFKWQVEAFTNVIKNCMEHSLDGGEIRITYSENALYTEVKIQDFGTGIEPEDLPHIFERFYKGKHATGESVGIGLALAKAIIEKDNGYIQADSKVGEGATFRVRYFH